MHDRQSARGIEELDPGLAERADPRAILQRLFCEALGWEPVEQPFPWDALPQAARQAFAQATIIAKKNQTPLCYLQMLRNALSTDDQQLVLDSLGRVWPTFLLAVSEIGQPRLSFVHQAIAGSRIRFTLDRDPGAAPKPEYSSGPPRPFDAIAREPMKPVKALGQIERHLKHQPRRRRRGGPAAHSSARPMRHRLLKQHEEQELRRAFRSGERHPARDKLILSNLRLVAFIAYSFRNRGLPWDDLLQEGACGLLRAADRFDPDRGYRFSTYATWWIWQWIGRAVASKARLVETPVNWPAKISEYRRFCGTFFHDHGFSPSDQEAREHLNLTGAEMTMLRQALAASSKPRKISRRLPCRTTNAWEERIDETDLCAAVERVVSELDPRLASVITCRFGLGGRTEQTLDAIGQTLSLTRERVRQLEVAGIKALKHPPRLRQLAAYLEVFKY